MELEEESLSLSVSGGECDEYMGQSGDVGPANSLELDPWASGRIEHFEKKLRRDGDEWEAKTADSGGEDLLEKHGFGGRYSSSSSRYSIRRSSVSIWEQNSATRDLETVIPSIIGESSAPTPKIEQVHNLPPISPSPLLASASLLSDTPLCPNYEATFHIDSSFGLPELLPQSHVQIQKLRYSFQHISNLASLATFAILGVLIRYGLDYLFGEVLQITNDDTALYTELPANMVGSFLMGWVGIILKKDISEFSESLAIGLSTGLMGSITTFASWNQRMIVLATTGHWTSTFIGYIIGMELVQISLIIGVDTAKLLKWVAVHYWSEARTRKEEINTQPKVGKAENPCKSMISLPIFLLASSSLWIAAVALTTADGSNPKRQKVWVACAVAPPGVWARWFLARLNGKGIKSQLRWLPVGTLLANLIAVGLEASLAVTLFVVKSPSAAVIGEGFQFGFLGGMSTVSTFVAEVYTMHRGPKPARAFIYILATLLPAIFLGILLYSIPVWSKVHPGH